VSRPSRALNAPQPSFMPTEPPSGTWWKFWQPDVTWLNQANMTNLRSLNATRLSVALVTVGIVAFAASAFVFLRGVWLATHVVDEVARSAMLIASKDAADYSDSIFNTIALFVGTMGGFAIVGAIAKRATDTEHVERVTAAKTELERARKAPVILTREHENVTNVNEVEPAPVARPTGDARTDDER
jgi:hypothetical protein